MSPRRPQKPLAAGAVRRTSATRSLRWQPARRSRKLPLHARALAPTMSAPPFHATSGRAALKSAMGNSTLYSQRVRSNRPRSDTGIKECRSTPKGVGRYPPRGTGGASREASGQSTYKPIPRAGEPRSAGNCRRDVASIETPNNRILGSAIVVNYAWLCSVRSVIPSRVEVD